MAYKGIVFDKDGTLIDFRASWLPVYRYAALEFANQDSQLAGELLEFHGYDVASGRFVGGSLLAAGNNHEIALAWAAQLAGSHAKIQVEALSTRLYQIFRHQSALNATPVRGLLSTLRLLNQAGMKLGIATNDSHQGIYDSLQSFDVIPEFEFLCGYDSGFGVKPEPGMVVAFCEAMKLDSSEVIVVGDNRHDIEMGKNAGAGLCVGVLTGASTRPELEGLADVVFDDIRHLPSLIEQV